MKMKEGVMSSRSKESEDTAYLNGRRSKRSYRYRLHRRGIEISRSLKIHAPHIRDVLDVGTADGQMLHSLRTHFPEVSFIALDISFLLLTHFDRILRDTVPRIQADACVLPFRQESFDAVTVAAAVEHISHPGLFVQEVRRVTRSRGLVIFTAPDPFWDKVATFLNFTTEGHDVAFGRRELVQLCEENGFAVLEYRKFMISPVGMPFEEQIERVIPGCMMANQIIAARRV